jgi:hypothetical protein
MHQLAATMLDQHQDVQDLNISVGTINRSAAQMRYAWLARNVRQVWLGERAGPRHR